MTLSGSASVLAWQTLFDGVSAKVARQIENRNGMDFMNRRTGGDDDICGSAENQ